MIPFNEKILADENRKENFHTYIDPFAGNKSFDSGDRLNLGKLSPGARSPNGSMIFGPISITGGDNSSGYSFDDKWIEGFSPNVLDGTGGFGEFGNFLFIPFFSNNQNTLRRISPLTRSINLPYKKNLIKDKEFASAGFYSVNFPEIQTNFRLTSNEDIALLDINDYSKNKGGVKIFLDPTRRSFGTCSSSELIWMNSHTVVIEIECPSNSGGWGLNPLKNFKGYKIYAAIRAEKTINSISFLSESSKRLIPNEEELGFLDLERSFNLSKPIPIAKQFIKKPKKTFNAFKFYLKYYSFFSSKGELQQIKIGDIHKEKRPIYLLELEPSLSKGNNKNAMISISTSFISLNDALKKYDSYPKKLNFDFIKNKSMKNWEEKLERFKIQGKDSEKKLFYTALYRALSFPTTQKIKKGDEIIQALTPFSGYDIYRSHFPFLSLFYPSIAKDQVDYIYKLSSYLPNKSLPIWSLAGQETNAMLGLPGPIVITQAIQYNLKLNKDIYKKSISKSFDQLINEKVSIVDNPHKKFSESILVEHAVTAKCILNASDKISNNLNSSQKDKLYKIASVFPFGDLKNDNKFLNDKNLKFDITTVESNRIQQSFSIHGSPVENILKLGGQEKFYQMHKVFLEKTKEFNLGDENNKYFRLENQIVQLAPYTLYYLDNQYRYIIEKYSQLITSNFSINPNGWPGNDDLGQLSSYFLFNSLGMHPISPCSNKVAIFPPIYEKVHISLGDKKNLNKKNESLKIVKTGNKSCNYKVYIDGRDYGPYPVITSKKLLDTKLIEHKYTCY